MQWVPVRLGLAHSGDVGLGAGPSPGSEALGGIGPVIDDGSGPEYSEASCLGEFRASSAPVVGAVPTSGVCLWWSLLALAQVVHTMGDHARALCGRVVLIRAALWPRGWRGTGRDLHHRDSRWEGGTLAYGASSPSSPAGRWLSPLPLFRLPAASRPFTNPKEDTHHGAPHTTTPIHHRELRALHRGQSPSPE